MRQLARRVAIPAAILLGVGIIIACVLGDGRAPLAQPTKAVSPAASQPPVRRLPAVAGQFYPADPDQLRRDVATALAQAKPVESTGDLVALIVPHAGYTYSAAVAAHAYRQLQGKRFDTVVVVGPSHRVPFRGAALSGADEWVTPLGSVPVDRTACEALAKADRDARVLDEAHLPEHSIEVQLHFLQTVLKEFKLLPLLMLDFSESNCSALARALAEWGRGRSLLLIASSDMSHYPAYDDAVRVDHETLKAIQSLDANGVAEASKRLLSAGTPGLDTALCGEGPVRVVLMAARLLGADQAKVLNYANSGDVAGSPRNHVVGYCAVAIYRSRPSRPPASAQAGELNAAQQQRLLTLARSALQRYLTAGERLELRESDPALLRPAAAFVTLRQRGQLRGCIGTTEPQAPLCEAVRDNAIAAGCYDPRFRPVTRAELNNLEIEISVLSSLRKVSSADEIRLPQHGVVVAAGAQRGVFLPQVATETGWSREEFLNHLCADKAGLSPDAWRRGASLSVFTVQAFSSPAPSEQSHGTRPAK